MNLAQLITYCSVSGKVENHECQTTAAGGTTQYYVFSGKIKHVTITMIYFNEDSELTFTNGCCRVADSRLGTMIKHTPDFKSMLAILKEEGSI